MRWLRTLTVLAWLMGMTQALGAAMPAADIAATSRRQTRPGEEQTAIYRPEPIRLPQKPWKVPIATLTYSGRGISLYYLIPAKRVIKLLPRQLQPYPGNDQIWFRVDAIQWTQIHYKNRPDVKVKKFNELAYRFEVKQGNKRATYTLKYYADTAWAVLWAREYGNYPAYLLPATDINFSPFIHFFQFKRGQFAVAVIDALPKQGMSAQMNDLFNRKAEAQLWQGDGLDFTFSSENNALTTVQKTFQVEAKVASRRLLLLNDPVKWKILTFEEVQQPDKVMILESVQGNWMENMAGNGQTEIPAVSTPEAEKEYGQEMLLDEATPTPGN